MSIDIIFNSLVIKAGEKFLPLVLIGSNNFRESDGSVVKSWSHNSLICDGVATVDEMNKFISKSLVRKYDNRYGKGDSDDVSFEEYKKQLGWQWGVQKSSTKNLTEKQLLNFVRIGVKQAITLDELERRGITLYHVIYEENGLSWEETIVKNDNDIESLSKGKGSFSIHHSDTERILKYKKQFIKPKTLQDKKQFIKPKTLQDKKGLKYTIVVVKDGVKIGYFIKNTKFGFRYCETNTMLQNRYYSEAKVKRALKHFISRNFQVEESYYICEK